MKLAHFFVAACVSLFGASAYSQATIVEPFNTGLDGWAPSALWPSTFGWSSTSHAGGLPGEIGGTLSMTNAGNPNGLSASLGTSLGGTYNLNNFFTGSGNFAITGESAVADMNYFVGVGFYNSATAGTQNQTPALGFQLAEYGNSTALRAKVNLGLDNGTDLNPNPAFFLPTNFNGFYTFSFNYNPTIGNGRLTLQILQNGITPVSGTSTINLTSAQRAAGATLDSFGLIAGGGNGTYGFENSWFDNFTATAVVPEPSSMALSVLGGAGLLAFSRRRRLQ